MKKTLLSAVAAISLLAGAGLAMAQTSTATTTTTWTDSYGNTFREYSTTQKYKPVEDKALKVTVGEVLPGTVTIHPLPPTIKVDKPEMYSYTIVNDKPVVVERSSRKIIRVW